MIIVLLAALVATGCGGTLPRQPEAAGAQLQGRMDGEFRDCADCPAMAWVRAGTFDMGSEPDEPRRLGLPDYWGLRESPRHRVSIARRFALGRTEITRAEFARFVADTGYSPAPGCWHYVGSEWLFDEKRSWRDPGFEQQDDHPATCVNWLDAMAYVDWLSARSGHRYRLPSEAEWEYAARAGTRTAFAFGDDPAGACRYVNLGDRRTRERFGWDRTRMKADLHFDWKGEDCDDGHAATAPVRALAPNGFGFWGLGGNANEWVADCWHDDYSAGPVGGRARTLSGDCGVRAMRGQGWSAVAASVRPAFRMKMVATDRRFTFGFRVARDP